jgi:16S rRNA (adenine1518-N6/adenine1519-N6)-dimethyltransferase
MERIKTKKSLGQHFLSNTQILKSMADAAEISSGDTIVEVGPGEGTLTRVLGANDAHIVAIEKDHRLIAPLKTSFADQKNITIVEADVMNVSPDGDTFIALVPKNYKIVANIPYYITGRFLKMFLEARHQPLSMTLMVQREIAERIVAKNHKESILSLSIKTYGTPSIIRTVPRGAFSPPPSVDSAIIHIANISDVWFRHNKIQPADFFALIKKAFGQKRKTLRASIGKTYRLSEEIATRRPETLSLEEWAAVLKHSKNKK